MIDSHCHLADAAFAADLPAVLARAQDAGVQAMVVIADDLPQSDACLGMVQRYSQLFCTAGVHPHKATDWDDIHLERLRSIAASSPRVRAIGEIGLDYHYDLAPRDAQRAAFVAQLRLAQELSLPAVVHCREAVDDVWGVVRTSGARIVLHCCTERWEDVEPFVAAGHLLSFTGIATYANAAEVRRTIEHCPLDALMVETDSPYLAPVPHRGKRNEPAFVAEVLACIARVKGVDLAAADRVTTATTRAFFGLPS